MGIELVWEEESGVELARLCDPKSFVQKWLPHDVTLDFVCLRFVDPYGDTVFNTLQLPVLLQELKKCKSTSLELSVAEHLNEAIELVSKSQGYIHTYVRFVGD